MKIAILSDIHGNLPALEAVTEQVERWQPDMILVNGDTINRGAYSPACWQFVRERGWAHTLGNHEQFVYERVNETEEESSRSHKFYSLSYWTFQQFNGQLDGLADLPEGISINAPDGSELRLRHGSMVGNSDGIYPQSPDPMLRKQFSPAPAVFVASHTHMPFTQTVDQTLIINSGSVGQPADGDVRASYAQVTWQYGRWQTAVKRVPYDREQTKKDFVDSGFLTESGEISWIIYYEWLHSSCLLVPWRKQYETAVLTGEIELETAVVTYLNAHHFQIPTFKFNPNQ
jgi:predicted phosphodiesterase